MGSNVANTSNIIKPVSVILANLNHVNTNVEIFADSRTLAKSLANYVKGNAAVITAAINRVQNEATQANIKQNLKANIAQVG